MSDNIIGNGTPRAAVNNTPQDVDIYSSLKETLNKPCCKPTDFIRIMHKMPSSAEIKAVKISNPILVPGTKSYQCVVTVSYCIDTIGTATAGTGSVLETCDDCLENLLNTGSPSGNSKEISDAVSDILGSLR